MAEGPGSLRQFLKAVVRPAVYGPCVPLETSAQHLHGEPIPAVEAVGRPFAPFEVGDRWGGTWDTTWFRFRGSIPDSWAGDEVVALIHLGGDQLVGFTAEGQIWDAELRPVQGLHHRHREFVLTLEAHGGEQVAFFVEAAANPIPPWHLADWPLLLPDYSGAPLYALEKAELAVVDRSVEGLLLDMQVLVELAASGLRTIRGDQPLAGEGTGHDRPRKRVRLGSPGSGRAGSAPRPANVIGEHRGGGRSRTYRLRLAMAATRDKA